MLINYALARRLQLFLQKQNDNEGTTCNNVRGRTDVKREINDVITGRCPSTAHILLDLE